MPEAVQSQTRWWDLENSSSLVPGRVLALKPPWWKAERGGDPDVDGDSTQRCDWTIPRLMSSVLRRSGSFAGKWLFLRELIVTPIMGVSLSQFLHRHTSPGTDYCGKLVSARLAHTHLCAEDRSCFALWISFCLSWFQLLSISYTMSV